VAESTAKILLRCGFRQTGKVSHVLRFIICDLFTDSRPYCPTHTSPWTCSPSRMPGTQRAKSVGLVIFQQAPLPGVSKRSLESEIVAKHQVARQHSPRQIKLCRCLETWTSTPSSTQHNK
jgi:hypothetical protein